MKYIEIVMNYKLNLLNAESWGVRISNLSFGTNDHNCVDQIQKFFLDKLSFFHK